MLDQEYSSVAQKNAARAKGAIYRLYQTKHANVMVMWNIQVGYRLLIGCALDCYLRLWEQRMKNKIEWNKDFIDKQEVELQTQESPNNDFPGKGM